VHLKQHPRNVYEQLERWCQVERQSAIGLVGDPHTSTKGRENIQTVCLQMLQAGWSPARKLSLQPVILNGTSC
jgi:hypothetical protein